MTPNFRPYYAVIFTSTLSQSKDGYSEMAQKMENLAAQQPGYIDFESARSEKGISISYWDSLQSIANWKTHTEHAMAQEKGRQTWYESYQIRICRVEREYSFRRDSDENTV